MDENENEKEYNDIESLAAYLHSEKMQAFKAAEERAEKGLPPEPDARTGDGGELESVLFSVEGKRRQNNGKAAISRSEYDKMIRGGAPAQGQSAPVQTPVRPAPAPEKAQRPAPEKVQRPAPEKAQRPAPAKAPKPAPADEIYDAGEPDDDDIPAKKKSGGLLDSVKKKLFETKKSEKKAPAHRRPERKTAHTDDAGAAAAPAAAIPDLAESLNAALTEKAIQMAEEQKDALPPEDTPEVFDVEEGSEQEETFDATATRLMNAVNDPKMRSFSMKEDIEAEEEEEREEKRMAARLRLRYERQKQGTRTMAYILIAFMLCVAIVGSAAYASNYLIKWALDFTGIASMEFKVDVEIPENADLDTVAGVLSENNIISDAKFFKFYAQTIDKIKGKNENNEFVGGKYTVSSTMSYSTLLSLMHTKDEVQNTVKVRITEGMTAREIAELLEESNVCFADDFEKYYKNIQNIYDFERRVKESPTKFDQLEGYLFPDTYEFYTVSGMENNVRPDDKEAYEKMRRDSEEKAKQAAKKMYSNFNEKITKSMYKKMGEMHLTLDEVVALASMVQKEAAYAEDMDNVASVFLNRIRNSDTFPHLQSDVTVIYVENNIKPFIQGTDAQKTKIYNAYNTYVCKGIPAGAVCNPGMDAINAVLYAPETPYFYFCANADTGEVFYAETQAQHEENLVTAGIAKDLEEAERIEASLNEME